MNFLKRLLQRDSLDGCDLDAFGLEVADEDIDGFVLFADLPEDDAEAIEKRIAEWEAILNGS